MMVDQLRRLGFLDGLTAGLYRGESVALARNGRIIANAGTVNYGLRYENLVNRARASLPRTVTSVVGRISGIETGDRVQRIQMADGRTVTGRVVIIATGQGLALCRQLGMSHAMIRDSHSLTFGFDIAPAADAPFQHSFLVYQRERIRDRMDYLAAFTMGDATRVNLFTYRNYRDAWTKAFIDDPSRGLNQVMPGLAKVIGPYRTIGPVAARPIDLYVAKAHIRPGVVLIGDAFQVACPATGMGMVRLLTDVERLCTVHLPEWLRTPGMAAAKIASYYSDPVKRACDAKALHDAEYRRAVSTETSLGWHVHRARVRVMERIAGWRKTGMAGENPRISQPPPEPSLVPG